jgi:GNAT superfamily N-acetyltransferase
VGFARVITDRATYGYLNDVFVVSEHRGRGLGRWLVECVTAHPDLAGLDRLMLTTRDAQRLYARAGFRPLRYPDRHLERLRPGFYPDE